MKRLTWLLIALLAISSIAAAQNNQTTDVVINNAEETAVKGLVVACIAGGLFLMLMIGGIVWACRGGTCGSLKRTASPWPV